MIDTIEILGLSTASSYLAFVLLTDWQPTTTRCYLLRFDIKLSLDPFIFGGGWLGCDNKRQHQDYVDYRLTSSSLHNRSGDILVSKLLARQSIRFVWLINDRCSRCYYIQRQSLVLLSIDLFDCLERLCRLVDETASSLTRPFSHPTTNKIKHKNIKTKGIKCMTILYRTCEIFERLDKSISTSPTTPTHTNTI